MAMESRLTEHITLDGDKTRELVAKSALETMNHVSNEISALQSAWGFQLGAFRNQTMKQLLRLIIKMLKQIIAENHKRVNITLLHLRHINFRILIINLGKNY